MIIIRYYNLYVPLNQNTNSFRHYGIKYDKILFFELHEILHVFSSECKKEYPPYIKSYFQIKSDYNLLRPSSYDISLILRFNKYLIDEMSSSSAYWIEKYILNNCNVVDWEGIQKDAQNRMNSKEYQMYMVLHTKLKKHDDLFRRISEWDTSPSNIDLCTAEIILNKNISCINRDNDEKENKNSLFNINEVFTNYDLVLPVINNSSNYLRLSEKNKEINLLEYLYFDVYRIRSDFNRNKDRSLTSLLFINKYVKIKEMMEMVKNKIVCVISNKEYVILKINEIKSLSMELKDKLKKKRKI
jgi:hypothetical protein